LTRPTAWQKEVPAQETELSTLPRPVVGCGVDRSVHVVPFHSSLKDAADALRRPGRAKLPVGPPAARSALRP